jgi:hypothetical protein
VAAFVPGVVDEVDTGALGDLFEPWPRSLGSGLRVRGSPTVREAAVRHEQAHEDGAASRPSH